MMGMAAARQLNLFRDSRQKGIAPPGPSEGEPSDEQGEQASGNGKGGGNGENVLLAVRKRRLVSVKHAQITGDLLHGLMSAHAIGEAPVAVVRHHDATVLKHVQKGA